MTNDSSQEMSHEIDGNVLVIRQNGVTDPEIIISAMSKALADPLLLQDSHLLWDATDAPAQASADKMNMLLKGVSSVGGRLSGLMAFVVGTQLQYGVSRMFSVYAESVGMQAMVFYDLDEAKSWLQGNANKR
jgi:hypothetical protein